MKKKLIGLLASLACLACFAGCNNPLYSGDSGISGSNAGNSSNIETSSGNLENSSSTNEEKSYDPQGAASYIESMYKNNNKTGRVDYEVVKKVLYDGDIYTIAWSVNVDCVTVVEEDDKFIIDVDEATTVDTPFILTATLTAPDGSTAKVELNRILTAAPSKVPAQITGDPVEGTEYKLYVYQAANKKDLYINGKMKNTYYFDTTDSFEEGISIYVEKTNGGFYLYHNVVEAEGEEPVKTYINIVKSGTHTNAKYETTASSVFVYDETLGTMVVNLDGTKYYLGADGTFNTVEPQSKLEDGYYMGYLVSLVDASSVTAEDKVEQTLKELSIAPVYVGNNEIELAKQGIRFADTKISWTVEGAGAVLDGNKLSLTAQSAASEITLKATAKNGEVSDEAELKFKLVPNTAAEIVKAATSLKAGESFGNSVELTGIVTAIPSPYAEQYANVTVSMLVEGKTIDAYRLVGVGADVLAKGYTVTVMGVITNYNGTVQFGQGCEIVSFVEGDESDVPEAPTYTMAQIVDMAYELAPGAKLDGTQTLKGVITKINTSYDAGYGNITVTIVVEGKDDKPIECYRLKGDEAASLKVGDTITVSGTLKHYSYDGTSEGKIEFDAGCTIDAYEAGEGVVTPPDDGGEKPVAPTNPAEILNALYALGDGESLTGEFTLTGKITALDSFNNPTIVVEGFENQPVYCYRLVVENVVGDTITVKATMMKNYMGTYEFMNCTLVSSEAGEGGEVTPPDDGGNEGETPAVPSTPEEILNALYALSDGESLTGEFTLTGKITALDSYNNPTIVVKGFENQPVYCYRLVVENVVGDTITVKATMMKNYMGTYEFMNCTLVSSETGEGGEVTPPETPDDGGETPDDGGDVVNPDATSITWSVADHVTPNGWANGTRYSEITLADGTTITASGTAVGNYGVNTGKYYESDGTWRIYQNENPAVTITAAEGKTIASVKVTYLTNKGGVLTQGETQVESDTVVTVNGTSVTFSVANTGDATNGQAKITAIEIVYA
ncbi:MAG: hypothetical protein IJX30_00280 [Clostridia bacterium]|nr:hypothetical protein [Clostridia bacterium]